MIALFVSLSIATLTAMAVIHEWSEDGEQHNSPCPL